MAKDAAQATADDAVMAVQAAEEARDQAARNYEHPGCIPLSGETVTGTAQWMTRFSMGADVDGGTLSEVDRMLAALPGWSMAVLAGIAQDAENKARVAERKTIEAEAAKRPRVVNAHTALAPGSVRMGNGAVYSPGDAPKTCAAAWRQSRRGVTCVIPISEPR